MAGTYKLIQAQTLSSSQSSVTFSSIPATYTDLVLRGSARGSNAAVSTQLGIRYNNNTGTIYSNTYLIGNGAAASSSNVSANNGDEVNNAVSGNTATANTFGSFEVYIPNYAGSTNKPISWFTAMETNATTAYITSAASLFASTTAISSLVINYNQSLLSGSSFYLYGIEIPAQQITPKATGGDITYDGSYVYHTFRQSGTFTPSQNLNVDYLVVAGGGSGGAGKGGVGAGGGGAGGFKTSIGGSALSLTAGTSYTATIGAGGNGQSTQETQGNNGSNSVFSTITSTGGGAGGFSGDSFSAGSTGGSGGGGGAGSSGGTGSSGQGNNGGDGSSASAQPYRGGGGGGASAVGVCGTTSGAGGAGLASSITGSSVTYAGGGGAGGNQAGGAGGAGGGGAGGAGANVVGTAGSVNTGGGGGGNCGNTGTTSGAGGSGIVIVRYAR